MKKTVVTLRYASGDYHTEWINVFWRGSFEQLFWPEAKNLFGARILDRVRKAAEKPVRVRITSEVIE